jgi:polar amino acid transport system substrate-binding protein
MCAVGDLETDQDAGADASMLAPTGVLRVGINDGNPNNAKLNAKTHTLSGVAVDLSCRLAARLGVPLVFTGPGPGYPGIPQQMADFAAGKFDVGFSLDPLLSPTGAITAHPHISVENHFLVPGNSPFTTGTLAELDQPGIKISVGFANSPDVFLKANLKSATLVDQSSTGVPLTVPQAINLLTTGQVNAFAGSTSVELPFSPPFRILPQFFMLANLAMFVPTANVVGQHYLSVYVEWLKKKGFIQQAITAAGLSQVHVPAPLPVGGVQ